jgi:hypothetical protein
VGEESGGFRYSDYFMNEVLRKRPYLRKEWCECVILQAVRCEAQDDNRFRFWARVPELGDRYLRVVTLGDKVTIHNAFPDRRFKP